MAFRLQTCLLLVCLSLGVAIGESDLVPSTTSTTTRYYKDIVASFPSQKGRCVAITGTTSGLGHAAAIAAAMKGPACIVLLNRASSRAVQAEEDVKKVAGAGVAVTTITCDLGNLSSVRDAAAQTNTFVKKFGGLDVLALNAGIMAQPDTRTMDGYDLTMQTNHLGHFLLTKLVMPSLKDASAKRGDVRIVTQSSIARAGSPVNATVYTKGAPEGAFGGDDGKMERYHQSKLANFVFSMALNAKLRQAGLLNIKALSAAPGISMTEINFPAMQIPEFLQHFLEHHFLLSAPDGACSILTSMFGKDGKSGDFWEPYYVLDGPPEQAVVEGRPVDGEHAKYMGSKDELYCSAEYADQVWKASEDGLGEKFDVVGESSALIV